MQQDGATVREIARARQLGTGTIRRFLAQNVPTLPLSKRLEISSTMARDSLAHIKKFVGQVLRGPGRFIGYL
jgi:hypothetical protein